jgi:hypothetical protein
MNLSLLAQATSGCTVNGQPIDCAILAEKAKPFIGLGIGILAFVAIIVIASFVFWLMMLIHASSHNSPDKNTWIIVLVVSFLVGFGLIAALLYLIIEKKKAELATSKTGSPKAPKTKA